MSRTRDVRRSLLDDRERVVGRSDLGDDLHVRLVVEDAADPEAHQGPRFDEHDPDRLEVGCRRRRPFVRPSGLSSRLGTRVDPRVPAIGSRRMTRKDQSGPSPFVRAPRCWIGQRGRSPVAHARAGPAGAPGRRRRAGGTTSRPSPARRRPSRLAPASAAAAYSRRASRGTARAASGSPAVDHRLLEPVRVDRVVDVGHRVELLGPDRDPDLPGVGRRFADVDAGQPERSGGRPEDRLELGRDPGRRAARVEQHPVDLRPGEQRPRPRPGKSVRRRAQTRRQPTTWVVPTSSDPTAIGCVDGHLRRADEPGQAACRVPRPVEAAARGMEPGDVLGVAQQDRRAEQAVRPGLVEPHAEWRRTGVRFAGHVSPGRRRARRGSRASTIAVESWGAVWAASRTAQDRSASKTTSATSQALVLVGGMLARVIELVEDVGVDPSCAPLAVVDLRRGSRLHGHVVRVDLGANAIEQDPALATDGGRAHATRRAASPSAPRRSRRGPGCGPARRGRRPPGPRPGSPPTSRAGRHLTRPGRTGSETWPARPSGSVVSPFMTARARTRWAWLASARSSAARATSGSAWMPA